ncbi:MAG: hypothetical protein HDT26_11290 [Subdoligranulum sp.]|nr:hypothetical protein [Subdoligranulum sp.]
MNSYEKSVFDMYKSYRLGVGEKCDICRKETPGLCKPISIWHVGDQYAMSEHRVLFVGKAARGSIQQDADCINGVQDGTGVAEDLYHAVGWPFWSYTRAIAEELYGEADAWEKISMTNMVKCNASETVDTTTESVKWNCAGYLRKEIELLLPKNIVFYTNAWYDEAVASLFDSIENAKYHDVPCGQKQMHLWRFTGMINGHSMRVIRTGHPERMKKEEFTGRIIEFIREGGCSDCPKCD